MPDSCLATPFRDRGSCFSLSASTLDAVYQLLIEADKAGAAQLLVDESKRIISPLVWTEDDLQDRLPFTTDLSAAAAEIEDLGEWEPVIERVNQQLEEVVAAYLSDPA